MAYKFIKGKNRISGSQTFLDALSGTVISASYFVGDGSQLTNISGSGGISSVFTTGSVTGSGLVINPITLKDPLVIGTVTASIGFNGNLYGTASNATQAQTASTLSGFNQNNYLTTSSFNTFTASYNTGTFTGSFIGTASYATSASNAITASYALNANALDGINSTEFAILTASNQFTNNNTISGNLNVTGNVSFNGGFILKRTSVSTNTTLNSSQHIVGVDTATATGSLILSLPNASTLASGQVYTVKDEGGMADTKTITISCSVGGQTIDGANSIIIESPYSAINIYTNGIDKYYIY